jgi:hypothetical protein
VDKPPAAKGFRSHNGQTPVRGIFYTTDTGETIHVHIAVLKLTEGPVIIIIEYGPEHLIIVMKRESKMVYSTVRHGFLGPGQNTQAL